MARAVHDGLSYAEFMSRQFRDWREMEDGATEYLYRFMLEPEIYARIQEEEAERRAAGIDLDDETADMPFRPLLARELKQIPGRAARIEAMHSFFSTYNEDARK